MIYVYRGDTVRSTVTWDAAVSEAATKNFALIGFYGINTDDTLEGFQIGSTGPAPVVRLITGSATGIQTYLDQVISGYANPGTYDCLGIIGDGDDPDFPYAEYYTWRFFDNVITVVP